MEEIIWLLPDVWIDVFDMFYKVIQRTKVFFINTIYLVSDIQL